MFYYWQKLKISGIPIKDWGAFTISQKFPQKIFDFLKVSNFWSPRTRSVRGIEIGDFECTKNFVFRKLRL